MQFTFATFAAFTAISSAAIVKDPHTDRTPNGTVVPLNFVGAEINWDQTEGNPLVDLFLANFEAFPPECIPIARNVSAASKNYTISQGDINCHVRGGTGYEFRLSFNNDCCGLTAKNQNPFKAASYSPSNSSACEKQNCA